MSIVSDAPSLNPAPTNISEYNQTAAAISVLRQKYVGFSFEISTTAGMEAARKARAEIRGYRVALEKQRVELKAPCLERARLIDSEAKRITAELLAIEEPIEKQIKDEEKRKEEEKAAKARLEMARIKAIHEKMHALRNLAFEVSSQSSAAIQEALDRALVMELDPDDYQELMDEAKEALDFGCRNLRLALENRLADEALQRKRQAEKEAEEARLRAEWEELERMREIEEARQAEARQAQEAIIKAQRDAMIAELQAKKEEQKRLALEAAMARQAEKEELERIKAEKEELERIKAELAMDIKPATKPAAALTGQPDPVADLKADFENHPEVSEALEEAYRRGYQDGLNAADSDEDEDDEEWDN